MSWYSGYLGWHRTEGYEHPSQSSPPLRAEKLPTRGMRRLAGWPKGPHEIAPGPMIAPAPMNERDCPTDSDVRNYCALAGASGSTAETPSGLMLNARKVNGSLPGLPHWWTRLNGS